MMKYIFSSIILIVFISCSKDKAEDVNIIRSDEIGFYSSFLQNINPDTLAAFRNINNLKLILKDYTIGYSDSAACINVLDRMNISNSSILKDYLKKNNMSYSLNMLEKNYVHSLILDSNAKTKIYTNKKINWNYFYELFPNAIGIATLSRVGFNKNNSIALLRVDLEFGETWGEKIYFVFEKSDNEWRTTKKIVIDWVH